MRTACFAGVVVGLALAAASHAADAPAALPAAAAAPECCSSCTPCGDWCDGHCECCEYGPPGRAWLSVEYLAWVGRGDRLPPLVSMSQDGTPLASAGVLGTFGTGTIFPTNNVNDDLHSYLRFTGGVWLDDCQQFGIEASGFLPLDPSHDGFFARSPGSPILARPFVDVVTGASNSELVSFPGVVGGSVRVSTTNDVWGGNLDGRYNLCCGCDSRLDALAGYRHLRLSDGVQINEDLTTTAPVAVLPLGTHLQVQDRFRTRNNFDGGELGLAGEWRICKLYVGVRAAVALGNVHQSIDIGGVTVVTEPGTPPVTNAGGLLAQGTNSGTFHRDDFAVLPAVGFQAGYQLLDGLRVFFGYDFMYLSTVTRPGNVIDLTINRTQVPPGTLVGPARPVVLGNQTDYWLQGISGGVEIRY
jgi:hypothetical protein